MKFAHFRRSARRLCGVVLLASISQLIATAAQAQTATPGGGAPPSRPGFGCAAGTTYVMRDGMARCVQPAPTAAPTVSCAAKTYSQGACSFALPASTSGTTASVANAVLGYTGQATATCSNGTWTDLSATCQPNGCNGGSHSFGACSFNVQPLASGSSSPLATVTAGYTGLSTASCAAGSLSFANESCSALPQPCAGGTIGWNSFCAAPIASASNGTSYVLTNVQAGYTGQAQFICSNGDWLGPYSASCATADPPACPAEPATTQTLACPPGEPGTMTQTRTGTCDATTNWTWSMGPWVLTSNTCMQPIPAQCPAEIYIRSTKVALPLDATQPTDTLPNGHAYCRYALRPPAVDDVMLGAFDLVAKQAVDVVQVFREKITGLQVQFVGINCQPDGGSCSDGYTQTTDSVTVFDHYDYVYQMGGPLAIQGAYCANQNGGPDPMQNGMYPGTCVTGGHGTFLPICKLMLDPNSATGKAFAAAGAPLWAWMGGDAHWGAYTPSDTTVTDGAGTVWHVGPNYLAYGWGPNVYGSHCRDGITVSWGELRWVPAPATGP